jgi:hypothetical protein
MASSHRTNGSNTNGNVRAWRTEVENSVVGKHHRMFRGQMQRFLLPELAPQNCWVQYSRLHPTTKMDSTNK